MSKNKIQMAIHNLNSLFAVILMPLQHRITQCSELKKKALRFLIHSQCYIGRVKTEGHNCVSRPSPPWAFWLFYSQLVLRSGETFKKKSIHPGAPSSQFAWIPKSIRFTHFFFLKGYHFKMISALHSSIRAHLLIFHTECQRRILPVVQ